jgi:hypothetical protein
MRPFCRVRVEVCVQDGRFEPLIDGPVVDVSRQMRFEPGQSTLTATVRDDTFYLNKDEERFRFDDESDYEIVEEIFDRFDQIADTRIDEDLRQSGEDTRAFRANGTAIQVLMSLAEVRDKHVYVLPGVNPGESVGCCKALPGPDDRDAKRLPTMVLLGNEANIRDLDVRHDVSYPADYSTASVRASDKEVVPSTAGYRDREALGESDPLPEGTSPSRRILRPSPFTGRDRDRATASRARRSGFAFEAEGAAIEDCYTGIPRPYRLVAVKAGETPLSGDYVVKRATHTLGRSSYDRSFTLMRDAESDTGKESPASAARRIF